MSVLGQVYFKPPKRLDNVLEEDRDVRIPPSTKMGCTLGPQSRTVDVLEGLLIAGMAVARFDFSYGTMEYHQETLDNLRLAMRNTRKLCAVMLDTMGPEIVVLNRPNGIIEIAAGQTVTLTCDRNVAASSSLLPISYPTIAHTGIQPGTSVFVGQYLFTGSDTSSVYLTVQEVHGQTAICVANNSCSLEGLLLTVHISTMKNEAPILSEHDLEIISTWGKRNQIDYVSLSFCRSAADVAACRSLLDKSGLEQTLIMAKLENLEGLVNYREILEVADAILFSRGNLGICLDPEKVFVSQKMLLRACNLAGKPVYVTRVVDTMTEAPRPTRAEATDVANLVLDGADGILLGSETFRGKYPEGTVKTVLAICKQAERCFDQREYYRALMTYFGAYTAHPNMSKSEALASSAVRAADKTHAALIIVFTVTGKTARLMAKYKPAQPILTVVCSTPSQAQAYFKAAKNTLSPNKPATVSAAPKSLLSETLAWQAAGGYQARQCLLLRGAIPISVDATLESAGGAVLDYAIQYAKESGMVKVGDTVVVSQCPRKDVTFESMEEMGVVKLVTIEDDVRDEATGKLHQTTYQIGSFEYLGSLVSAKDGSGPVAI